MAAMAGASEARAQSRGGVDELHFQAPPTIAMRFGPDAATTRTAGLSASNVEELRSAMQGCVGWFARNLHLDADGPAWWYAYRHPQGDMPVLIVDDEVIGDPELDIFASYRHFSLPRADRTLTNAALNTTAPMVLVPRSIFDRPFEVRAGSACHELLHAVLTGTVIRQAGNRPSDVFGSLGSLLSGERGLPWWINEGAPDSAIWMFHGGTLSGRNINLYRAARALRDSGGGSMIFKLLGLRPYSDSIFVDHWLPRTGEDGSRARSIRDAQDHAYRTSSFHRWLRSRTTSERWFRAIATVGSLQRARSDVAWLEDFMRNYDSAHVMSVREQVPRFFASFAHQYERVSPGDSTGGFSQAMWLRRVYPKPEHCERYVFQRNSAGEFELTVRRRTAVSSDLEGLQPRPAVGHVADFLELDPYASRCVQIEAKDNLGQPIEAAFNVMLTRPAAVRDEQDPYCDELTLATRTLLAGIHLPSAPNRGLNRNARLSAQCHVATELRTSATPTAQSPATVLTIAYVPRAPRGARPTAVRLRVTPQSATQVVSSALRSGSAAAANGGSKSSAPKDLTPASAPFVNLGAVVLHDDGPTSCDPAWRNFCGPATEIDVARTREQATLLEGRWAVPPSMVRPIPDSLAFEDIAELPVPTLTVPSPRAPGPQVTGIRMPRLAPGQLGLVNNAELSAEEGDSLGPVAQRVDARCARRRFPTTARVNITVNDGFVLAGTFEAELYTDQGATPDREGCVRVRRSAGTIRGSFSTGLLSSGWYFQDTHEDFARIMGNSASSGFDRPNTWMYRFLAQRSANSANQQGSGTGGMTDANGAQIITRALAAGAQVSLPAQCACSCGEFLSPLLRSSCGGSCASAFAEFDREPQRCAGQQASAANSAGARAPTDAETEAQWAAFLQRLPESSRERLRRQVESNPDARMMMIRMVLSMQQSITPMRTATDAGVTR